MSKNMDHDDISRPLRMLTVLPGTQMFLLSGKQTRKKSTTQTLDCSVRKRTREDNKQALFCYFRCKPTKKKYRKRMIKIWIEFARFKRTILRLADQVWTITKIGWFSDLEILEIYQQIYRKTCQQTSNTVAETLNTVKPENSNQTLLDNDPSTTDTQTQILTKEEIVNIDTIRRIMAEKKTTLASLKNQDWRTAEF